MAICSQKLKKKKKRVWRWEKTEAIDDFLSNELEKRVLPKQDQVITITMIVMRTFAFFLLLFLCYFVPFHYIVAAMC